MFQQHPQQIENLVRAVVRANGLETPLLQRRLLAAWDEVGDGIFARFTRQKEIRNQTLHVWLQNPALRSELSMMKSDMVRKLNAIVGARIISDIAVH